MTMAQQMSNHRKENYTECISQLMSFKTVNFLTHFLALLAKETLSFHYTREIRLTSLPSSQNLSTLILPIARDS